MRNRDDMQRYRDDRNRDYGSWRDEGRQYDESYGGYGTYRGEGWTRFDPAAPAYRPSDVEIQRLRTPYQN